MASNRNNAGFTVIELLAAMTILIFLVMMMTRVFTETSGLWDKGADRAQTAAEGRVIMDFIVKEMTQAIADDIVSFKLNSGGTSTKMYGVNAYGADSDEVCFVAGVRPPPGVSLRNSHQFVYFIAPMLDETESVMPNRYRLVRVRKTGSMYSGTANLENSAYRKTDWWRNMNTNSLETIAENVAGFEVWAFSEKQRDYVFGYDSTVEDNLLPSWVDIYLELLGEDDAVRAAILWDANPSDAADYVSRNVRRFNARVFFPNRERALAFR